MLGYNKRDAVIFYCFTILLQTLTGLRMLKVAWKKNLTFMSSLQIMQIFLQTINSCAEWLLSFLWKIISKTSTLCWGCLTCSSQDWWWWHRGNDNATPIKIWGNCLSPSTLTLPSRKDQVLEERNLQTMQSQLFSYSTCLEDKVLPFYTTKFLHMSANIRFPESVLSWT